MSDTLALMRRSDACLLQVLRSGVAAGQPEVVLRRRQGTHTHTHSVSHTFTHHATAHSHHIHTSFLHTAQFVKPLERMLSLAELQSKSEALPEHADFISQPRLCVFPAPKDEWDVLIEQMPKAAPPTHLVGAPETPGARGGA
jgi:predicted RNA-binding protein with PUA-like domain